MKKSWFRPKKYVHIGEPLLFKDKGWIHSYVANPANITKHSFFPFIHKEKIVRKFRRKREENGLRLKEREPGKEVRKLFYSNHFDAMVYGYYSNLLSNSYNEFLRQQPINECVTAYRRLPLDPNIEGSRNKCNIDFANDVFNFIRSAQQPKLVALTFDIKDFFDSLNHRILKEKWIEIIGAENTLPDHHYNVFRNITKFSYIKEDEIFKLFKSEILVERNKKYVSKKVDRIKYFREKKAVAYCDSSNIKLIRSKNLIKSNKYQTKEDKENRNPRKKGIPQGSPISATLANIYLLNFDTEIEKYVSSIHGMYRRYSDDIVIIADAKYIDDAYDKVFEQIKSVELSIQPNKCQTFIFTYSNEFERFFSVEYLRNLKTTTSNTRLEYLGFQFDGETTYLKSASLATYYRKMKTAIARGIFYTTHNRTKTKGELFKARLYKRYTFLGSNRRRIYKRDKNNPAKFVKSTKFDWGNFITYVTLASKTMKKNKIKHQLRNHWKIFHQLIKPFKSKQIISQSPPDSK